MTVSGAQADPNSIDGLPGRSATPDLRSDRLTLSSFTSAHLTETYVGWLNDPAVMRYSENRHRAHSLATCKNYFDAMQTGGHFFWAIHLHAADGASGTHIGNITAYADRRNRIADLAIVIGDRAAWGRGLGRESWTLAQDWLLQSGCFHKVTAGTMALNAPMLKIFAAAGMREEGRRSGQFLWQGQRVDLVLAAKFAG